jgi:hypothetical protein
VNHRRHISIFLLLISTLLVVPKDLVHELTSHTDSHDEVCQAADGVSISTLHHHCDILQVFESPFTQTDPLAKTSCGSKGSTLYTFYIAAFSVQAVCSFSNRGPPVC